MINFAIVIKFMTAKCKTYSTESTNQALVKVATRGTAMVVTVSVTFLLLTTPTAVNDALWHIFQLEEIPFYHSFMNLTQYLNHSINGVLYCIVGSRFRMELVKILNRKGRPEGLSYSISGNNTSLTNINGSSPLTHVKLWLKLLYNICVLLWYLRNSTESTNRALVKVATRGTAMVVTVSVTFLLLTTPTAVNMTQSLETQLSNNPLYRAFMNFTLYLNHSINGVLYVVVGTKFRSELLKLICRRKERSQSTSSSQTSHISRSGLSCISGSRTDWVMWDMLYL